MAGGNRKKIKYDKRKSNITKDGEAIVTFDIDDEIKARSTQFKLERYKAKIIEKENAKAKAKKKKEETLNSNSEDSHSCIDVSSSSDDIDSEDK